MAATLGSCQALQIRAHRQVITAESVEAALVDSIHFVENAEAMYAAAMLGPVRPPSEADIESFASSFLRGRHVEKLWRSYVEGAESPACRLRIGPWREAAGVTLAASCLC